MFENIGGKIKKLAKIICWIGIIISALSGIALIAYGGSEGVVGGLMTIVVGCLASWVSSFFAYGFGQLIENTDAIRDNTQK